MVFGDSPIIQNLKQKNKIKPLVFLLFLFTNRDFGSNIQKKINIIIMVILDELFNSKLEVKFFRLFLRNLESSFSAKEVAARIGHKIADVNKEIIKLHNLRFLTQKTDHKSKGKTYSINAEFPYYSELKALIFKEVPVAKERIVNRAKNLGKLKLLLVSGIFLNLENTRTDMLVVTDGLSERKMETFLKDLEAEVGKEINYSLMGIEEFYYRKKMYDKFLREIFKGPHEIVINKLQLK